MRSATLFAMLCAAGLLAACTLQPSPPPQIDMVDFGGTGDLMAKCMQYGSQSYCERQIWGGGDGMR